MDFFVVPSKDDAEISEKIRQDYIRENPHVSREQPRTILVKSLLFEALFKVNKTNSLHNLQ